MIARRVGLALAIPAAVAGMIGLVHVVAPDTDRSATSLLGAAGASPEAPSSELPAATDDPAALTDDGTDGGTDDGTDDGTDRTSASPTGSAPSAAGAGTSGRAGSAGASGSGSATTTAKPATPTVVRGQWVLRGPATVPSGGSALFVLQGPKRVVRADRVAPFAVRIDTRAIPDGQYTFVVSTVVAGKQQQVRSGRVTVANGGHRWTPVTMTATPTGVPGGGSGGGSGSGGASTGSGTKPAKTSSAGTRTSGSAPAKTTAPAGSGSLTAQVVALTNAERASKGCPALTVNAKLTAAAQAHSADMAAKNYFSHDSKDGRNPFQRIKDTGYSYRVAAENIAAGQRTPESVMTAWMNSAGHRANILNCSLTQIGVGYATGGTYGVYWTQDFGTPA